MLEANKQSPALIRFCDSLRAAGEQLQQTDEPICAQVHELLDLRCGAKHALRDVFNADSPLSMSRMQDM